MSEVRGVQWVTPFGESHAANLIQAADLYLERYGTAPTLCYAGRSAFRALASNRNVLGRWRDIRIILNGNLSDFTMLLAEGKNAEG